MWLPSRIQKHRSRKKGFRARFPVRLGVKRNEFQKWRRIYQKHNQLHAVTLECAAREFVNGIS